MIILVYGHGGSGPGHWQRWLEGQLRDRGAPVMFPDLPEPDAPHKDAWVSALGDAVARAGEVPVTFVCHSLGCWALDHLLVERAPRNVRAVLLVAPPSPYLLFEPVATFFPPPRRREAWAPLADRTLLVGSDNDDFTAPEEFVEIAGALGVRWELIPGAGHINVASGHGPWPFVLDWLGRVAAV